VPAVRLLKTCIAGLLALATAPALACSICRCGDPTFNALGKEGVAQTGLRLAFDWDEVEKTQGPPEARDAMREQRLTALAAFGINDRFDVFARIPYSERRLAETAGGATEVTNASGWADPEFYAQARLWSSGFEGDVGIRSSLYLVGGIKTDWGQNDLSSDGERLDEHAQPGTGSADWFGGLSGSYQINPRSSFFASAQYRHTGRNDAGYRYGRISLFNVAYEHKLGTKWDAVVEANFRHAGRDEIDDSHATDPDTGGSLVYLTPRLLFDVGGGWVVRAAAQIPLSQGGLYGEQHEKPVYNIGVTRLFGSGP
jgi:hypothetical protein